MKFQVEIDGAPNEARQFLGFPDVAAMQDAPMKQAEAKIARARAAMDPETTLKTRLPTGMEGLEQMQKAFFAPFGGG